MDVDDGVQLVGLLPQRLVRRVGERRAVDVAEHHRAGQAELLHRALELATDAAGSFSGSVASAVNCFRRRTSRANASLTARAIVTAVARLFEVHAGRRERDAPACRRRARAARPRGNRDRDARARGCCSRPDNAAADCLRRRSRGGRARALLHRVEVFGRVVVIVEVDDHAARQGITWESGANRVMKVVNRRQCSIDPRPHPTIKR